MTSLYATTKTTKSYVRNISLSLASSELNLMHYSTYLSVDWNIDKAHSTKIMHLLLIVVLFSIVVDSQTSPTPFPEINMFPYDLCLQLPYACMA